MNHLMRKHGQPVTNAQIETIEQRLEVTLPPVYRQFLLVVNGGTPHRTLLDVPNWPGKATLMDEMFDVDGLVRWTEELAHDLPPGFVAAGVDPGGNFLCIGTIGEHVDQVYYWDASADWNLREEEGTMFRVADDIEDMLEHLEADS
ncbi:SMI1 / KNR4 family protein [Maioricimonas rarisocia]|uniref:SMI1 / KNR4 family protein n=1 Tax=Maioricimonas rarisocia TaxID=2528026 RepID=A0A517Z471_9PLAN|nr:SMI1/KNR4 family protein [Maioricimonas rarisocia]QDU37288.1 SMI1 / KNR4 family protein [Maioricimonas rarisocia]